MDDDAASAAYLLAAYARQHAGGVYATPSRADLERRPGQLLSWGDTVAVARQLTEPGRFRDFTGALVRLPRGATVITHLARIAGAPVPELGEWDFIHAYATDLELSEGLRAQGREVVGTRVTASSAIIHCWGRHGTGCFYGPHDRATVVDLGTGCPLDTAARALGELELLDGWVDDAPYYNRDGSWSSLALRGYSRSPFVSVKPPEMGKAWLAAHPELSDARCDWTTLAPACPALIEVMEYMVPGWRNPERVRLLRMAGCGRGGKVHHLLRHSDITDRTAGMRDGQIARFHVPLITHPHVTLTAWELDGTSDDHHLRPFRAYYLDQRKPHAVTNPTPVARIHLVVDVAVTAEVRAAVTTAYQEAAA